MTMTLENRRLSSLPPEVLSKINCTYRLTGTHDLATGMRYLLKRSDGVNCNVDRNQLVRIMRMGKLLNEHGLEVRHV